MKSLNVNYTKVNIDVYKNCIKLRNPQQRFCTQICDSITEKHNRPNMKTDHN